MTQFSYSLTFTFKWKSSLCAVAALAILCTSTGAQTNAGSPVSVLKQHDQSTVGTSQAVDTAASRASSAEPGVSKNRTEYADATGTTSLTETQKGEPAPESDSGESSTSGSTSELENDTKLSGKNGSSIGEPENGDAEPENNKPEPEGEAEPETGFAEPTPEWDMAKNVWKEAWAFHVYFFGLIFSLIGLYCLACVIRLWGMDHLLSKHYFLSLNVLNITVCAFRAVYLFVDAYNSRRTFPAILDYFLYSTVFPCFTAMFSLLFYALLLATRFKMMSQKIQKLKVLVGIISFHFCLSFVTDIVVGISSGAAVLIFICQSFYVIWGFIMFICYIVIFKRLLDGAINRQDAMKQSMQRKYVTNNGVREKVPKHRQSLGLAVKITLANAFFGVACLGFQLFGMFGVYGVIGSYKKPGPWQWWAYHSGLRLLEILMCLSIAFVSSQPLRYSWREQQCGVRWIVPCCVLCRGGKPDQPDSFNSISMDSSVVSESKKLKK